MIGFSDWRASDYDKAVLKKLLAGNDAQTALQEDQPDNLLSGIGRFLGGIGGGPTVDDLSPFTRELLATKVAPGFEDPVARKTRIARLAGLEAGTEHTGAVTEGVREETAASRETRPLKIQNMRQELDARKQDIEFIAKTNPDRAKLLTGQVTALEDQIAAEREKRPLEIKRLNLDLDIAQEGFNQSKDLSPMKKQYMQAQINDLQQKLETQKEMTPLEIQQMKASIEQIKANTGLLTARATGQGNEPFTPSQTESAVKIADRLIEGAKAGDWFNYDYTKVNLIKQYQKFRTLMKYQVLTPATQAAYDQVWNSRIEGNPDKGQYEWDDKAMEEARRSSSGGQRTEENPKSEIRNTNAAPDAKLEPYWAGLNDNEKQLVQNAIKKGHSIDTIIKSIQARK